MSHQHPQLTSSISRELAALLCKDVIATTVCAHVQCLLLHHALALASGGQAEHALHVHRALTILQNALCGADVLSCEIASPGEGTTRLAYLVLQSMLQLCMQSLAVILQLPNTFQILFSQL